MLPLLHGCDEPDPACEGAKYEKVDLSTSSIEGGDILSKLKWHMAAGNWCFYHRFNSALACGKSTLDLVYFIRYSAIIEDQPVVFNPYLVVNGKRFNSSGFIGGSFDGNSFLMKGGVYEVYDKNSPYEFGILCGIELKTILLLTKEQAEKFVRTYLRDIEVKLEYLKL